MATCDDTQDVASLLAALSELQPPSAGSAAAANPLRLLVAGGAEGGLAARRSIRKRATPARLRVSTAAGIVPPGGPFKTAEALREMIGKNPGALLQLMARLAVEASCCETPAMFCGSILPEIWTPTGAIPLDKTNRSVNTSICAPLTVVD